MTQIAPQILAFTKASSSAEEIFKTIDRQSEIDPLSEEGIVPDTCIGNIRIECVSFAYPARPDVAVLNNLQLSAPANQTTALVGASGSGKSTIIGLLERWYDQPSGTIYLDGTDIRQLNLHWLRTNIRLVQQEPVLFAGTVYDNIAYGLFGTPKASLPAAEQRVLVERACKDAYADEFIERLPNGYDTDIGLSGSMLSAGQRQRIGLARALFGKPFLVVLDEPNSNLDSEGEVALTDAIIGIRKRGGIVIVVAHRPSALAAVDFVLMMKDGGLAAFGPKDEVLSKVLRRENQPNERSSPLKVVGESPEQIRQ